MIMIATRACSTRRTRTATAWHCARRSARDAHLTKRGGEGCEPAQDGRRVLSRARSSLALRCHWTTLHVHNTLTGKHRHPQTHAGALPKWLPRTLHRHTTASPCACPRRVDQLHLFCWSGHSSRRPTPAAARGPCQRRAADAAGADRRPNRISNRVQQRRGRATDSRRSTLGGAPLRLGALRQGAPGRPGAAQEVRAVQAGAVLRSNLPEEALAGGWPPQGVREAAELHPLPGRRRRAPAHPGQLRMPRRRRPRPRGVPGRGGHS